MSAQDKKLRDDLAKTVVKMLHRGWKRWQIEDAMNDGYSAYYMREAAKQEVDDVRL